MRKNLKEARQRVGLTQQQMADKLYISYSYYQKPWMEDKETWLFDLAHGNLDEDGIVKGFIKHYALEGQGIVDVQQNLHFHTCYGDFYMESAMSALRRALEGQVEAPPRSEMRTLEEVEIIVQAVRAGEHVQVDYYDPELDDDDYVYRVEW